MCGLTGFLNRAPDQTADELRAVAGRMVATLHHRGPDDTGTWCDPAAGIALGHKRLSIVDLSPTGHQPMTSENRPEREKPFGASLPAPPRLPR